MGFRKAADVNWWARRAPGEAHLAVRARPRGASRCTRGEPPRTATAGPRERLAGASRTFFELANVPPISCVRAENTLFVLRVRVSRNARGHRRHGSARGALKATRLESTDLCTHGWLSSGAEGLVAWRAYTERRVGNPPQRVVCCTLAARRGQGIGRCCTRRAAAHVPWLVVVRCGDPWV